MDQASKSRNYKTVLGLVTIAVAAVFFWVTRDSSEEDRTVTKNANTSTFESPSGYTKWETPQLSSNVDSDGEPWDSETLHANIAKSLKLVREYIRATASRTESGSVGSAPPR